ncbi:MAG: ExbD/TolR family protein [Alphaproteobacteria bacterium]
MRTSSVRHADRMRKSYEPLNEINITPFVDVILVLLIVFMLSTPMLSMGVPVDLPKVKSSAVTANKDNEPLIISIDKKGVMFLQKEKVSHKKLLRKLLSLSKTKGDLRIFIRGDKTVRYGKIMEVMGYIRRAGYSKISLITEMPDNNKKG